MCIIEVQSRKGYPQLITLNIFPIKSKPKPYVLREHNSLFISVYCNIILHQKTPQVEKKPFHFSKNSVVGDCVFFLRKRAHSCVLH